MMNRMSIDDVTEEFKCLGVILSSTEVAEKMIDYCTIYQKSPEEIVTLWMVYSTTKQIGGHVTLELARDFEKDELRHDVTRLKPNSKTKQVAKLNEQYSDDEEDFDLLESYGQSTIQTTKRPLESPESSALCTPKRPVNARLQSLPLTPVFSPSVLATPGLSTPSVKYSSRTNSGQTVATFGEIDAEVFSGKVSEARLPSIQFSNYEIQYNNLMFEKSQDIVDLYDSLILDLAAQIKERCEIQTFTPVGEFTQGETWIFGRIMCDSVGRLNAASVLLEGSREFSGGRTIRLDLSQLQAFALFPGQVVAVFGTYITADTFAVNKICESVQKPLPELIIESSAEVQVVIAAGPFTTSDNLMFEPLIDLIAFLQENKPDIVVFIGPFLDCDHEEIQKGVLTETFESVFNKWINFCVAGLSDLMDVIFVPSLRDVHHCNVLSTAPYKFNRTKPGNKVLFTTDPCSLNIGGCIIGITSVDVPFHIGKEEISIGSADRLGRLVKHVLTQQNFYPLYPPSEDVQISCEQFSKNCKLTETPHVLVIPSDLRQNIKDIEGCIAVNPGRLAKGQVGGTFVRMRIKLSPGMEGRSLRNNIAAKVERI